MTDQRAGDVTFRGVRTAADREAHERYYNLWTDCHAGRDGECFWTECPQLRDNEPKATNRHCPLDLGGDGA